MDKDWIARVAAEYMRLVKAGPWRFVGRDGMSTDYVVDPDSGAAIGQADESGCLEAAIDYDATLEDLNACYGIWTTSTAVNTETAAAETKRLCSDGQLRTEAEKQEWQARLWDSIRQAVQS